MEDLGIFALYWGFLITGLGFIVMIAVMMLSKRFEATGSIIALRTSSYTVIAGLTMMILALAFMMIKALH